MLRPLYDAVLRLSAHRRAGWVLGAVSFTESSVFPVPPDLLLVPMIFSARARAWT
ncbi:MAG: DedA family protein, partial [Pseudomonadota bacterium]|nr:DedA family protein [Pseudomonadota bacterium]